MEGLPVEMVAEVLGWVGARDLLGSVTLVCQQWAQLCGRSSLWRLAFLRTWPPPLCHLQRPCVRARPPAPTTPPSSGATARPPAGKKIKSNNNIAWKSLCVGRLQLERGFDPELGVAEVVEALRSALDVAEHRLFVEDSDGDEEDDDEEPSSEADDDISQQLTKKLLREARDKRRDSEEEEEEEEEGREKRATPAVTKKRAASGLHRNKPNRKKAKVVTARPRARTRLLDQARVAAVRKAAERVEEILEPLANVSYMKRETRRFLDALAKRCRRQASVGEGAEARENAHHLFSLLCDHVLYSRVDVDIESDGEECFHQVSVLIYSLTTGLPLRISFTHGVDASGCLSCGLKWERIEGDDFRGGNWFSYQHPGTPLSQDPEPLNALVAYLCGEANVDLISHSNLQAFLQAVLVAHPTITTFYRLW